MAKTSTPAAPPAPQPPYLKRVHLRNVPPLRDVKADFKPGLNIIIGKNGSGKTNFMRLVSELTDLHRPKYRGVGCDLTLVVNELDINILFKDGGREQFYTPSYPRSASNRIALKTVVTHKSAATEHEIGFVAVNAVMSVVSPNQWNLGYQILSIWHGIPNHRQIIIDEGADLAFDDAGSMSVTSESDSNWPLGGVLERALIDSVVPYDIGSLANKFTSIASEEVYKFIISSITICLDNLNTYLPVYSPIQSVRLGKQFQVYSNSTKDELIVKGLTLEYLIAGDWLPFSALSDGTKRIFYIVGELTTHLYSIGRRNDIGSVPIDVDKIIFLEEPELGIHPDQLQLLLQLIREVSREHQVIMTTHSPQTLDMLSGQELDRITICEFIPGKGTQMRKLSAAKKNKAKAYLRDQGFLSEFWRFSNLEDPD